MFTRQRLEANRKAPAAASWPQRPNLVTDHGIATGVTARADLAEQALRRQAWIQRQSRP